MGDTTDATFDPSATDEQPRVPPADASSERTSLDVPLTDPADLADPADQVDHTVPNVPRGPPSSPFPTEPDGEPAPEPAAETASESAAAAAEVIGATTDPEVYASTARATITDVLPAATPASAAARSTASQSLPPPSDQQAVATGPSPACPQCEAPMAWVDAHLRFYCKSCKMYF